MKQLLLVVCLFFSVTGNLFAQELDAEEQKKVMELMSIKVDMTVDTNLFIQATPNTYISESPQAVIMAMVVPETYKNAKAKLGENLPSDFKVSDSGEKTINGIDVLFLVGIASVQGIDVNTTIYFMKRDDETCLMFTGMLEVGADKKYEKAIAKAANSMIKKK